MLFLVVSWCRGFHSWFPPRGVVVSTLWCHGVIVSTPWCCGFHPVVSTLWCHGFHSVVSTPWCCGFHPVVLWFPPLWCSPRGVVVSTLWYPPPVVWLLCLCSFYCNFEHLNGIQYVHNNKQNQDTYDKKRKKKSH